MTVFDRVVYFMAFGFAIFLQTAFSYGMTLVGWWLLGMESVGLINTLVPILVSLSVNIAAGMFFASLVKTPPDLDKDNPKNKGNNDKQTNNDDDDDTWAQ